MTVFRSLTDKFIFISLLIAFFIVILKEDIRGENRFISKPISPEELLKKIGDTLESE